MGDNTKHFRLTFGIVQLGLYSYIFIHIFLQLVHYEFLIKEFPSTKVKVLKFEIYMFRSKYSLFK